MRQVLLRWVTQPSRFRSDVGEAVDQSGSSRAEVQRKDVDRQIRIRFYGGSSKRRRWRVLRSKAAAILGGHRAGSER